MTSIPRTRAPDATVSFLREGYAFVGNRCRALGSDVFRTRLMLRPAVFMQGVEAAGIFYAPGRFTRRRAVPITVVKLLQDFGSVQTLDGAAHAHRKRMFMGLMGDASIARLVDCAAGEWRAAAARWPAAGRVTLLDEAEGVLTRAACRWAGIDADEAGLAARTRDFSAMIAGAGNHGPGAWARGEILRTRNERWARRVVERIRAGPPAPDAHADAPARVVAGHRAPDGSLLPAQIAAVELVNLLRPIAAVAYFVAHAALALHRHPHWRERLRDADDATLGAFVQEVRRLAPFFPVIAGRVREPFEWRGERFGRGAWMLLDLFGTNRDPRAWDEPRAFRPERFLGRAIGPHEMVPQGGGPFVEGHRCPGEWIAIALLKQAVRFLARDVDYRVPEQDLSVDLGRVPAAPASRFVVADARRADGA